MEFTSDKADAYKCKDRIKIDVSISAAVIRTECDEESGVMRNVETASAQARVLTASAS